MPTAYTHQLIAEDASGAAKEAGVRLADYYFGAQGADPLFFYRFVVMRKNNPGRLLHTCGIYDTFSSMLDYARSRPEALGYALGYVTHCAADSVFHPYVYYRAYNCGATRLMRSICHTQDESDFDTHFLARRGTEVNRYRLPYLRKDIDLGAVSGLYVRVLSDKGVEATEAAVRKAVRGWGRFLFFTTDRHFVRGTVLRGLGRISKRFRHLGALLRRKNIDRACLNEEHAPWNYRGSDITSTDGVDELYVKAVERAKAMTEKFLECWRSGEPLPREEFCLGLLTGLPEGGGESEK